MDLVVLVVCLLGAAGCLSVGAGQERGCSHWTPKQGSKVVCCRICKPGNRMVQPCGPDPTKLCVPCEPDTYTEDPAPRQKQCRVCTQCVGAQILKKNCTSTKDTECGCKPGLRCGDGRCSFCVRECGRGEEPTSARICRPCPEGTFNNQTHQKCQPWRSCLSNDIEVVVVPGSAVKDVTCSAVTSRTSRAVTTVKASMKTGNNSEDDTKMMIVVIAAVSCILFILPVLVIIFIVFNKSKKTEKVTITGTVIGIPTTDIDEPRSLLEGSYPKPQQEQGSSSESLSSQDSQDSKDQLIV